MGNLLRLRVIVAFSLLALLCAPIWYFTTRVERAALPHRAIKLLTREHEPQQRAQAHVRVVLPRTRCTTTSFASLASRFHIAVVKFDVVLVDEHAMPTHLASDADALRFLAAVPQLPLARAGQFDVVAVGDAAVPPTWGVGRAAWFGVSERCDNVADAVASLLQMYVVDTAHASAASRTKAPASHAASRRIAVKSAPVYHATFTLLSSDPQSARVQWDFARHERRFLAPLLGKLERVARVVVTSQVLHHAPLSRQPDADARTEQGEHIVDTADVQRLVDPHTWRLNSIETNSTTLHFVVFVPPANAPLRLRNADGSLSRSNAFLLPQWGGVAIRNLPRDVAARVADANEPAQLQLSGDDDLASEMSVFVGQLKRLLGLPSEDERRAGRTPGLPAPTIAVPAEGITEYEIDYIMFERICENLVSAKAAMHSQSRLVASLTTMKVLDHIRALLERAIAAVTRSELAIMSNDVEKAYELSVVALADAETAFFDRDMIAMLYYPTEHNLAIYLSFFLPMSLPFLSAAWTECGRWREKRRKAADAAKAAKVKGVPSQAKGNNDE
jgi:hypothetical protein